MCVSVFSFYWAEAAFSGREASCGSEETAEAILMRVMNRCVRALCLTPQKMLPTGLFKLNLKPQNTMISTPIHTYIFVKRENT